MHPKEQVLYDRMRIDSLEKKVEGIISREKRKDESRGEWHFDFGLCTEGGDGENETITMEKADELFQVILKWARLEGLYVGGSFHAYREEK
jgi:hypothetical protein